MGQALADVFASAIQPLDTLVFRAVNQGTRNPVFDSIMPVLSDLDLWRIPLLCGWLFLILRGGSRGRIAAVALFFVVLASDRVACGVIKPWFARVRPCHVLAGVRLLEGCNPSFSFPSAHAANTMGGALLVGAYFPRSRIPLVAVACMVGYSRIYVGVHYPIDVLGGMVLGGLCALGVLGMERVTHRLWAARRGGRSEEDGDVKQGEAPAVSEEPGEQLS